MPANYDKLQHNNWIRKHNGGISLIVFVLANSCMRQYYQRKNVTKEASEYRLCFLPGIIEDNITLSIMIKCHITILVFQKA